jgi:AraC-like DNA-binding protein
MVVETGEDSFRARVVADDLGPLGLRHMVSDPYRGLQTRRTVGRAKRARYILTIATEGSFHMSQFGRDVVVDGDCAALHSTMDPVEFIHGQAAGALMLTIPAELLRGCVAVPEDHCGRAIQLSDPHCMVSRDLLFSIARSLDGMDAATRSFMANRLLEMLAGMFAGRTSDRKGPAVRSGRLRGIQSYIDERLCEPDLPARRIAEDNGVSERYLYDLFRQLETTPGRWLRERRLARARRALNDPAFDGLPIASIAAHCGFANSAHFSTAFRKRYGSTPRDARRRSLK